MHKRGTRICSKFPRVARFLLHLWHNFLKITHKTFPLSLTQYQLSSRKMQKFKYMFYILFLPLFLTNEYQCFMMEMKNLPFGGFLSKWNRWHANGHSYSLHYFPIPLTFYLTPPINNIQSLFKGTSYVIGKKMDILIWSIALLILP